MNTRTNAKTNTRQSNYFIWVLFLLTAIGCQNVSEGGVQEEITKEEAAEKAEVYLEEHDVPYVVVDAFKSKNSDIPEYEWLVYRSDTSTDVSVALPSEYVVAYKKNNQQYRSTYTKEGKRIEILRLNNMNIVPEKGKKYIETYYKDWNVTSVYEKLDTENEETIGFIVTIEKENKKEKVFFDMNGKAIKVQTIRKRVV